MIFEYPITDQRFRGNYVENMDEWNAKIVKKFQFLSAHNITLLLFFWKLVLKTFKFFFDNIRVCCNFYPIITKFCKAYVKSKAEFEDGLCRSHRDP